MQRFRQPQKMQGPLFPIEDNELIDAINDFKNIPHEESTTNDNEECKPDITFDAENHNEECKLDITVDAENHNQEYKPDITVDAENHNQECKPDITFDAENHMEVIEIDDIDMESNEYTDEIESEAFNEKDDKENIKNIKKEKDKTVNMFCKYYYFKQSIFYFIIIFIYFRLYLL